MDTQKTVAHRIRQLCGERKITPHPVCTHGMILLCDLWTLPAVVRRA